MGAYVVEGPDPPILAAHHYQPLPSGVTVGPEVVRVGQLALVAGEVPDLPEDLLLLFAKDFLVRIDERIDVMGRGKLGLLPPLHRVT